MGRFRVCTQTRTPLRAKNQKQEGEIDVKKIISIALALLMVAVMLPVMAMAEGTNVAKIGTTEYATLEDAFTAVATTDATTITLLNDAVVNNKIIISDGKNITLDLGGHNVTISTLGKFFYVNNATFTVNGSGSIKEAAAYLAPIIMTGGPAGSENYSVVNVNNGVTLEGWAGMFIDQNKGNNYGMVFNAENATLMGKNDTNGDAGVGLYVNGTINANVKIALTNVALSGTGDGMYLAGAADTTINGGSVTSNCTGIEIRAGSLTLNNCNVTGGNGSVTTNANGNGSTSDNVALAVIQHTTKLPIHVEINGGTFKGTAALLESNPQKNPEEATKQVGIIVNGGNFEGMVCKAEPKDGSSLGVMDGSFNSDVTDYVHASPTVKDNNGKYYVGSTAKNVVENAESGSFEVLTASESEVLNVKSGVTIVNNSNTTIRVNGNEVAPEKSYTVPGTITIIVPSEGGNTTTTPSTDNTKNPGTGANDFVGVAAAMAVVSLLGAAAVIRKK
uniref:hypothetical protein n=1 Tax=Angelakisella sp. TaxID=1935177 RepID=UPI004026A5D5